MHSIHCHQLPACSLPGLLATFRPNNFSVCSAGGERGGKQQHCGFDLLTLHMLKVSLTEDTKREEKAESNTDSTVWQLEIKCLLGQRRRSRVPFVSASLQMPVLLLPQLLQRLCLSECPLQHSECETCSASLFKRLRLS